MGLCSPVLFQQQPPSVPLLECSCTAPAQFTQPTAKVVVLLPCAPPAVQREAEGWGEGLSPQPWDIK